MIKDFIKDIGKYLPSKVVPAIMGFISIPIVTHLFPPAVYGDYVLVLATVAIFSTISGWLNSPIIRFYPAYKRDSKLGEFYGTVIKLMCISIAIVSLIYLGILFSSKNHISANIYYLMRIGLLVFILTACFGVLREFLRTKRQVGWYTGFTIWWSVTALGFGIALIMIFHYGVEGLLWGSILSTVAALPLLWKMTVERSPLKTKGISIPLTSEMAKYGFPIAVGGLAAWILSLSDRYILGLFRGSIEVGIYSASYSISASSILLLTSLFLLADRPFAMNIWEKEGEEGSQEFLSKLTRYYLIVCLPAVVGLSALAKPVIDVLVPTGYYGGYRILPFITLGVFFLGLGNRFQLGTLFYKKTYLIMLCTIASGLLNVGLNLLLVPKYGYMAAAITTLIGYTFYLVSNIAVSRSFFVWEFPFKSLAKISFASIVMGVVVYYIGNSLTSSALINLISGIFVGVVVYVVMLLLLREPKKEEIQKLQEFKIKLLMRMKQLVTNRK